MTFVDFCNLRSNGVVAKIVILDFDLLFQGQRFESRPSAAANAHISVTSASTAVLAICYSRCITRKYMTLKMKVNLTELN